MSQKTRKRQVAGAGIALKFNRDDGTDQTRVLIDEDCFAQIIINRAPGAEFRLTWKRH